MRKLVTLVVFLFGCGGPSGPSQSNLALFVAMDAMRVSVCESAGLCVFSLTVTESAGLGATINSFTVHGACGQTYVFDSRSIVDTAGVNRVQAGGQWGPHRFVIFGFCGPLTRVVGSFTDDNGRTHSLTGTL